MSIGQLEAAAPGATTLTEEGDEVWTRLEEKLGALAAAEYARQCSSSSLGCESKKALGELAQLFVRRIVEIFQQATKQLPRPDQQAAARAAIRYLFTLDLPLGPRGDG